MNTSSNVPSNHHQHEVTSGILARFGQVAITILIQAIILFLGAGKINWIWAWIFLGIYFITISVNGVLLMRTSPEMVAERGKPKEMKDWDKVISGLWGLAQFLVTPLIAALDMRFGWTHELRAVWHIAGALIFAIGIGLFSWAMIANTYFSTMVRIQSERGHQVCSDGPYRFVRHPGYVGAILQSLGVPFLLGSFWALIPAGIAIILMILRTALEDRTLQSDLSGYQEYAQKVRYRLIPGLW
ncbi:MAG: methyltransferase family protein [Chloroflexota bacterium]